MQIGTDWQAAVITHSRVVEALYNAARIRDQQLLCCRIGTLQRPGGGARCIGKPALGSRCHTKSADGVAIALWDLVAVDSRGQVVDLHTASGSADCKGKRNVTNTKPSLQCAERGSGLLQPGSHV
jgi:hypothetical protein